jgi:hypothetical protein
MIRIKPMILEFCPDLSQRVKPIDKSSSNPMNILKKRNKSSKQRDEDHHASNHSSIILDDTRTLAAIYIG